MAPNDQDRPNPDRDQKTNAHEPDQSVSEDSGALDQEALDALVQGMSGSAAADDGSEEAPVVRELDDDEIDDLMSVGTEPDDEEEQAGPGREHVEEFFAREPEEEDDVALDQNALDALLADVGGAGNGGSVDQSAIDELIGGQTNVAPEPTVSSPPDKPVEDGAGAMDQSAIDALMAESSGRAAQGPEPGIEDAKTARDEGLLDQAALDALMAEAKSDPQQTSGMDEPVVATENGRDGEDDVTLDQEDDVTLDQAALDALLSEQGGDRAPMGQDGIDALLAAGEGAAEQDIRAEAFPEEMPSDAVPEPEEPDDVTLDQAALDALLDENSGGAMGQDDVDALLVGDKPSDSGPASQDDIDALIASGGVEQDIAEAPAAPKAAAQASGPLGQSDIDALIASGGDESQATDRVGSENVAAAGSGADKKGPDLLTQDMLDAMVSQAKDEKKKKDQQKAEEAKRKAEAPPEPAAQEETGSAGEDFDLDALAAGLDSLDNLDSGDDEAAVSPQEEGLSDTKPQKEKKPAKPRRESVIVPWAKDFLRDNAAKCAAALAAMLVLSIASFTYLYTHPMRVPDMGNLAASKAADLVQAVRNARRLIQEEQYDAARHQLENAIENAPPSRERADAEFLYLEAATKALPDTISSATAGPLQSRLDDLLAKARSHPRAAEALLWKAQLYQKEDVPHAASEAYDELLRLYADADIVDEALYDAAKNAMGVRRYRDAAAYLDRLLQEYPGSPMAGDAKLLLGDVYLAAGQPEGAESLYMQVARSRPETQLGGQALRRLGNLFFEQQRYDKAVEELQRRLETATSIDDNDRIYLMLAQAHRAMGDLDSAENVLRELLSFFPETDVTPQAMIELSQILEAQGKTREATLLAAQARERFPTNANVLLNEGRVLARTGQAEAAAEALVAAEEAGAKAPELLLDAGRKFLEQGNLRRAVTTFDKLRDEYGNTPEAFEGSILQARALYDLGQVERALTQLESLNKATASRPQQLPVLIALGELYTDLGLADAAGRVYAQVAEATTEPEMLAKAALALLKGEQYDDAFGLIDRIDMAAVSPPRAYDLLTEHGRALLRVDAARALEKQERAYKDYSQQRTEAGDLLLLDTYLARNLPARARALVADAEAAAMQGRMSPERLEKLATRWADFLYKRGDYRAAADAYVTVIEASDEISERGLRAMYQRASALLELADFEGSLSLFDRIAQTKSPWAREADIKAEYARLEQRLRGQPVTPQRREVEG